MDSEIEQSHKRAIFLAASFDEGKGTTDCIEHAIALDRQALQFCPTGHQRLPYSLHLLAYHLGIRYKQLGALVDIDEAVILDREGLRLSAPEHPSRTNSLNLLAVHLSMRYRRLRRIEDLDEAIFLSRESMSLRPPGDPNRPIALNNRAIDLYTRFQCLRRMEDLDEIITLIREALRLMPPGDVDNRSGSMHNLSFYLSYRYDQFGVVADLDEAISLTRQSLMISPPDHPKRSALLNSLGSYLSKRYSQLGAMDNINEAIARGRDALELRPPNHPDRSMSLGNLAVRLSKRYGEFGVIEDLDEAIALSREALMLHPPGNPKRPVCLNDLAGYLVYRGRQLGAAEDIEEAIVLDREALEHCPSGHPNRAAALNRFAAHLFSRYQQLDQVADLDQAITFGRDAAVLYSPEDPDRVKALYCLAAYLAKRYICLGAVEDLDEALTLDREALVLRPQGHPERCIAVLNLAAHLYIRYEKLGSMVDLEEAIGLDRDALALRRPGHPKRPCSLEILAKHLSTRFTKSSQSEDKDEMFSLYANLVQVPKVVTFAYLFATFEWVRAAERFQHPMTIPAYKTSLRHLTRHLTILPSLGHQLNAIRNYVLPLGVDAFSACLRHGCPTKAVELLEQGRTIFWSQLSRLRSPLDDVRASGPRGGKLADRFKQLASQIPHTLDLANGRQRDNAFHRGSELKHVMSKIRKLPLLSRFLLPLLFSDLQQAASEGPVVVVNASEYSCDALVILLDRDPVRIPLQITQKRVLDLATELDTWNARAKSVNVTRELASILRILWKEVVSPIVDLLRTISPFQSRIWWCPTAEFSSLPLHVAGPYRKGEKNLSDLYISSYTPTLIALIHARRPSAPKTASEGKQFLAVGQAKKVGQGELGSVSAELDNIIRRVDGLATITRINGDVCRVSRVAKQLRNHDWVHFACHTHSNQERPLESAFLLHDGPLAVNHLIQCQLENPEFAYLSASCTTVGDTHAPDEAVHLASAMLFAGFRSVIGTSDAVDDGEANRIASTFYAHMVGKRGGLDHTRAALALRETMRTLVNVPMDQRIAYVHFGA